MPDQMPMDDPTRQLPGESETGNRSESEVLATRTIRWAWLRYPTKNTKIAVKGISTVGITTFLLWAFNEFTTLRGWVNVLASRLLLVLMWLLATSLSAIWMWGSQIKRKKTLVTVAGLLLMGATIALDQLAPKPISLTEGEHLKVDVLANLYVPPDGKVGSIEWQPEYTHIQLSLTDPSQYDFDELDMTVRFDIAITATEQITDISGVSMFPDLPAQMIGAQFTATDEKGNKITIPTHVGRTTVSGAYRIRCDHVPKHSVIRFVAAGVVLNIPDGFSLWEKNQMYGPKRLPTRLDVSGSYKVAGTPVNFANHFDLKPLP